MTLNGNRLVLSTTKIFLLGAGLLLVLSLGEYRRSDAKDKTKEDESLSAFMRKKLDASSQILEGLTTEDAEMIKSGAKTFIELSKVEKWNILTDATYREISSDFRTNARKLIEAAEKENFDNAALQWFDATKNCIECHKHIRRERAGAKPKTP